jgi:hypothetical protein
MAGARSLVAAGKAVFQIECDYGDTFETLPLYGVPLPLFLAGGGRQKEGKSRCFMLAVGPPGLVFGGQKEKQQRGRTLPG